MFIAGVLATVFKKNEKKIQKKGQENSPEN